MFRFCPSTERSIFCSSGNISTSLLLSLIDALTFWRFDEDEKGKKKLGFLKILFCCYDKVLQNVILRSLLFCPIWTAFHLLLLRGRFHVCLLSNDFSMPCLTLLWLIWILILHRTYMFYQTTFLQHYNWHYPVSSFHWD